MPLCRNGFCHTSGSCTMEAITRRSGRESARRTTSAVGPTCYAISPRNFAAEIQALHVQAREFDDYGLLRRLKRCVDAAVEARIAKARSRIAFDSNPANRKGRPAHGAGPTRLDHDKADRPEPRAV